VLYRRPHGQEPFTSTEVRLFGPAKFVEAPDHTLWVSGYGITGVKKPPPPFVDLNHIDALGKRLPGPLVEDDATDVAIAADGALWVSHEGSGLRRLRAGEMKGVAVKEETDSPDTFSVSDGLTNTGYRTLLRDREGNIWSSGARGVDRFQRATMESAIPAAMNGLWSVCIAPDRDIWLSLYEGFLGVFRNHRLFRLNDRKDRPVEIGYVGTYSLECDRNGSIWLMGAGGIGKLTTIASKKFLGFQDTGVTTTATGFTAWQYYRIIGYLRVPMDLRRTESGRTKTACGSSFLRLRESREFGRSGWMRGTTCIWDRQVDKSSSSNHAVTV
jgi:hypothetical protein